MREKTIAETSHDYKNKLRFIVLTMLLVVFYTTLLFSATIYIDPTNTASNQNGTITNPYSSWNSVTFTNGNIYLQKRGTTFSTTGGITLSNRSNITLGAYGTGPKPVIISSSTTSRIIRLTNSSNCTIRDLELTSSTGILGPIAVGIDGSSDNNLIDSCRLHNCEYGVNMNVDVGTTGNRILNTIIHTMGDDGMYLKDMKDIEIGNCHIYNINRKFFINPDQTYSAGDCIQLVGNQSVANALVVNIHDNILDHSSTGNKFCIIIVGDYYSGTIEGNTLTGSSSTSCIYLWHTTGTMIIKNNILQDGAYSIYSYVNNLQVQYNKIMNNSLGIFILPSTLTQTNLTALNNVFYNIDGACISLSNSSSTLVSKNNAFFLTSSSGKAYSTNTSPVTSNFNNFNVQQGGFINGYGTLASWQSATGNDLNSFIGNPLFVNPAAGNLCLQPTSPCINTGTQVNLQSDFFGTPVPQGNNPDIGHHEYLNNSGGTNLAPVINNQLFQINENSANGTTVGTVTATDPNAGQTISYSITGGNTNNAFSINPATGLLTVANSQALNFETIPSFSLSIRATDNGTGNLWSQATVTVNLVNVNESPSIANQSFTVVQNAANGTVVGTVSATDPDAGQTLTFSITAGNTGTAFYINPSTGRITVANPTAVVPGTFNLTVRATDNGSPVLFSSATISITVTTTNQAPVIANQTFSLVQYSPNGTNVGTVVATDPNAGQTLVYAIIAGNTSNAFAINASTGVLTVSNSSALSPQAFSLTVRVTDNGSPSLYSQATVTVNVTTPPNQAPVMSNQSFSLVQYSPNGTLVGTMTASDPNAGQTLTFSMISGNTGNAFAINATTGAITVNSSTALAPQTFSLTIRVTDNGTPVLYTQATATITVTTPPNLAPVISSQAFSTTANSPNGTVIGTVIASDPNAGQTLTYTITAGNTGNLYALNSGSGILTVANSSGLIQGTYSLTVRVTDNGTPSLWAQATVTITVTPPVNQAPVISNQSFSVSENTANGTLVGNVVATDPNSGQVLTYQITGGNTNNVFSINSVSGALMVNNSLALNFEYIQSYALLVRVTDNGAGNLWSQATISVLVVNVNEAPVINPAIFEVAHLAANGTGIGVVSASDPDVGQSLTYQIISGNTSGAFTVNTANGAISVANSQAVNYYVNPVFYLTVRVVDNGQPSLNSQAVMTINLLAPPPNQPPVIANQSFTINENAANGTQVGIVAASDPDPGQVLAYSITSGNANSVFAINPSDGRLTVSNSFALNFEYIQSYALTVRVTDNGTGNLWSQATISVGVNNVNETPVINPAAFEVAHLAPNGTSVGTVSASDPDVGQSLTYQIISGNTSGAFSINASNGAISVVNSQILNYNVNPVFYLTIRVLDNGQPSLNSQAVMTINILAPPANQAPVITNQSFSMNENSANGTLVGTITATDPDPGQTLTYSIISGNTNNAFLLQASTGVLSINNSMVINYEYIPAFTLTIRATDNGTGNLYSQATVTVNINNLNEAPALNQASFSVAQFAPNGTFVGVVSGSDPDLGQSVTFQIISGNTSNAFNLNATNGALNVVNSSALNANVNPTFFLNVRIQDNGQPSLFSTGIIRIDVIANKNLEADFEAGNPVEDSKPEYLLYPNPTYDGLFSIKSESGSAKADIQIYDTSGKLIDLQEFNPGRITGIDLSTRPAGLYVVKIIDGTSSQSYKIVKK